MDSGGTLVALDNTSGLIGVIGDVLLVGYVAFCLAVVIHQVIEYRRSTGAKRAQLKWLVSGGAIALLGLVIAIEFAGPSFILVAGLPIAIGVGVLRYRLYEIDRLINRTASYAILTAVLVGIFIGLIALTTDTLALSGRVGVAASTLAAAAMFNPLRIRVQRLMDRRFNRARYDAEAIAGAFTTKLRNALEIDTIRADPLGAVNRAVEPDLRLRLDQALIPGPPRTTLTRTHGSRPAPRLGINDLILQVVGEVDERRRPRGRVRSPLELPAAAVVGDPARSTFHPRPGSSPRSTRQCLLRDVRQHCRSSLAQPLSRRRFDRHHRRHPCPMPPEACCCPRRSSARRRVSGAPGLGVRG